MVFLEHWSSYVWMLFLSCSVTDVDFSVNEPMPLS